LKPLSIDRAVDGNLKPVKDSDGTLTALEVSTDTVRVKNLVVAGKVEGSLEVDTITAKADLTLDVEGDLIVDVAGGQFTIQDDTNGDPDLIIKCTGADGVSDSGGSLVFEKNKDGTGADAEDGDLLGTISFNGYNDAGTPSKQAYAQISCSSDDVTEDSESGSMKLKVMTKDALFGAAIETGLALSGSDTNDEVDVTIGQGTASMTTIAGDLDINGDTITTAGAISLDSGGAITLDAHDGSFIAKKAGTEFSAANSAYAGMILGYTRIQDNSTTPGTDYITINSSSMTVLQTVAGTNLSINFKAPPSGNVEISCSFWMSAISNGAKFSLSTGTSYAELDETHTYDADQTIYVDENDHNVHTIRFAVTGLTAGTDTTYYLAGFASGASVYIRHGRFRTAGTHSPPVILKAIALPATIVTGE